MRERCLNFEKENAQLRAGMEKSRLQISQSLQTFEKRSRQLESEIVDLENEASKKDGELEMMLTQEQQTRNDMEDLVCQNDALVEQIKVYKEKQHDIDQTNKKYIESQKVCFDFSRSASIDKLMTALIDARRKM